MFVWRDKSTRTTDLRVAHLSVAKFARIWQTTRQFHKIENAPAKRAAVAGFLRSRNALRLERRWHHPRTLTLRSGQSSQPSGQRARRPGVPRRERSRGCWACIKRFIRTPRLRAEQLKSGATTSESTPWRDSAADSGLVRLAPKRSSHRKRRSISPEGSQTRAWRMPRFCVAEFALKGKSLDDIKKRSRQLSH